MSIDLSQFKQTFIEESDEGLDVLESGLLALDSGSADDEVIHAVFRAAHSIKGSSGNLKFNEMYELSRDLELSAKEQNADYPYEEAAQSLQKAIDSISL